MIKGTVIITGSSSGIGKACATFFLSKNYVVIGISRSNDVEHKNFHFIQCDLSQVEELEKLNFKNLIDNTSELILINNAGTLGEIKHFDHLKLSHFEHLNNLNILAPQYLITLLFSSFSSAKIKAIVNISSGAAKRPIASWGAYCASKAALDMYSETLLIEFKEKHIHTKIYSVAPGVVDTNMQNMIRSTSIQDFSEVNNFISLKSDNKLRDPKNVATMLYELITYPLQKEVVQRL